MSVASSPPMSLSFRWLVIAMLMGYAAIGHFNRVSISVAGDEVFIQPDAKAGESPAAADTKSSKQAFYHALSDKQMGWVYFAFLLIYTSSMLPGGWLIDRIGAARALVILGLGMGSFVALTGTLGWFMKGPEQFWISLLVIRGLAGMFSAPLHPGAAHVVSDVASLSTRATANGLVTAGALLGIAFSYPVFGHWMDQFTWQWAFVLCGSIMVGYGFLWRAVAVPRLPGPHASRMDQEEEQEAAAGIPWKVILRKDIWLVTLSYFAYSYYQYLFFYWMGYYFKEVLHVPNVEARQAAFTIALSQGAGMVVGGVGNDFICRILGITKGRRVIMVFGMTMCALLTFYAVMDADAAVKAAKDVASATGLAVPPEVFSRVVFLISLALACEGMCEAIYWTSATEIGGKFRGFACGFLNTGGNVGGFISPVLTPYLAERIGWTAAIGIACAICALGGMMWLGIRTTPNRTTSG